MFTNFRKALGKFVAELFDEYMEDKISKIKEEADMCEGEYNPVEIDTELEEEDVKAWRLLQKEQ